ncbi:hypothetical protein SHIRM173S_08335 [Streptomyces hirsutus]
MPLSEAQRRGSPVRFTACWVPPWYERYAESTLGRPVCSRAIRTACSTASAPPLVKKTLSRSPGVRSADSSGCLRPRLDGERGRERRHPRRPLDRGDDLGVLVADALKTSHAACIVHR